MTKLHLKGMSLIELETFMLNLREPKFRAKQIYNGIYKNKYESLDEFTNLPTALKNKIQEEVELSSIQLKKRLVSVDGTQKFTFEVESGKEIESVWIPTGDLERKTICISSQVGCTLSCEFCATGTLLDYKGNLKAWQIIDQIIQVEKIVGDKCTNIVFMGMGEPMHNYNNVIRAASIFHDKEAFDLGAKRITISTAGVISGIDRFVKEKQPYNFAISLNHPDPEKRTSIMNVNKKYPLSDLLKSARNFTKTLGRKITFEFIMIPDVNMDDTNAKKLVKIARSVNCKINLIPLNTDLHGWRRPTEEEVLNFQNAIQDSNVPIMNRRSPGKDIHGACGMLALQGY